MCGLIALLGVEGVGWACDEPPARRALERMHSRGPDAEGVWRGRDVALGHRRLAIIDLDERAAQPMTSACGRYVIVFNGEIYNFRELRRELEAEGVEFKTVSDTEVILALFARQGPELLARLHGMFAFVIWDRKARRAFAARDPYGIKPMYIGQSCEGVVVASQVKAILATGIVASDPCPYGRAGFWLLGSVPEPYTFYDKIRALPAGHAAWIQRGRVTKQWCWHDVGDAWRHAGPGYQDKQEVQEFVRDALAESVRRHLVADVPVGVFLSGGIDSGALAGMMTEHGVRDLVGVTIAYDEFSGRHDDEAPIAAVIAAHYGIRHHIRRVTKSEFQDDLPRILDAMDQPSVDGVNTWYASKAVAELGLKVVVSGVGGDELFQGYPHFRTLPRLLRVRRTLDRLPGAAALLSMIGDVQAKRTGNDRWRQLGSGTRGIASAWWLRRSVHTPCQLQGLMGRDWTPGLQEIEPAAVVHDMVGALPRFPRLAIGQIESLVYLRNQLLRDSDWASMDHSVELRTPLVDAHLLRTVGPLLGSFSRFPGKSLLANAPGRKLPRSVTRRKKTGFGIPLARWLEEAGSSRGMPTAWMCRVYQAQRGH